MPDKCGTMDFYNEMLDGELVEVEFQLLHHVQASDFHICHFFMRQLNVLSPLL